MVDISGIPRAFSPAQLAQKVADLERKVERLTSARNYVTVGNIVEGGTISQEAGTQLTETVKKEIVIDGGNLGEGALDGQRMVGAIIETNGTANRGVKIDDSGLRGYDANGDRYITADETGLSLRGELEVRGKTAGGTPQDLLTRLTNVQRTYAGTTTGIPGLTFTTDGPVLESSPGVYSPDGVVLRIQGQDFLGMYHIDVGPNETSVVNPRITLGRYDIASTLTQKIDVMGAAINIGTGYNSFIPGVGSTVKLQGNVTVNGGSVMKTVTPNIPAGQQPIELIANGSVTTNTYGEFTITFPAGTFPTACIAIFIVPNSGGGTIPVVNGTGGLTRNGCSAVQPGNVNKSITYSYRAIGY